MPQAPAFVGTLAESLFGRTGRIRATTQPVPGLLEVRLSAPPPSGGWHPSHELQIRVTPTHSRRYSVWTIDPQTPDQVSILVSTQAGGPGTTWAQGLPVGSTVGILAGRYLPLRQPGTRRLYLGDESALGTIDAHVYGLADHVVAIEARPSAVSALAQRWPSYRFLPATGSPGDALQQHLGEMMDAGELTDVDGALLLGHAQSLQRQRTFLIDRNMLPRRSIATKPYWATGKRGL